MPNRYANLLQSAIEEELEAYEYYTGLSQSLKSEELRSVFAALAEEELGHRDYLQELLDNKQYPEFDTNTDLPRDNEAPLPPLSNLMKPQDGIALAISKEDEAMRDYLFMASCVKDNKQKKILENLARMEQGHKERLERILASGTLPENW
ncbi:MAG: ferritin family protein [Syntrophomonadaceae bacterium]